MKDTRTLSVADRLEIHELYARHNHANDSGDVETLISLYAAEGGFVQAGSGKTYRGREELRRFFLKRAARADVRLYVHWTSNVMITATAEGVEVRSYGMLVENSADGHRVRATSLKIDELRQEDGAWLFQLRQAQPWPAGLAGAEAG